MLCRCRPPPQCGRDVGSWSLPQP